MKLGIMQPYFFPYIGYFQLINLVDRWIAFDNIQFIDKGWINRNRILHADPSKEWLFITVPLNNRGQFDKICDISIKMDVNWRSEIMGKLSSYKKKSPYYKPTVEFVASCLDTNEENLSRFVVHTLRETAKYLGIDTPIELQSEMNMQIEGVEHPGQWALRISELLDANEYINPSGGSDIFNQSEFDEADIKLSFIEPHIVAYNQKRGGFIPGLSIIDVLMWNDISSIKENLINSFNIKSKSELDFV